MQACKCGSRSFKVDAIYTATDYITLADDDSEDFDITDTQYGDGEWHDDSRVTCTECGAEVAYSEWSSEVSA